MSGKPTDRELEIPAGYTQCIDAMAEAARRWVAAHPGAEIRFTDFYEEHARQRGLREGKTALIASLSDVAHLWAGNENARSLLQAMVDASKGEGTFLQAQAIIRSAHASALDRGSGRFSEGDWTCTGCGKLSDGFTNIDGNPNVPGPGAVSVCWNCGAFQRVTADGLGYEALSVRDFNRLPKELRKTLLKIKRAHGEFIRDRNERN